MIRILYQVGNRRNSSPTLEVGVFLLEEDKTECNYDTEQCTTEIYDGCSGISGNDHFRSDIKYNHHCKNSSDPKYHVHLITFATHQTGDRRCAKGCKYNAEHDKSVILPGVLHSENRACQGREASHDAAVAAVHQHNSNRYCQGS